MKYTVGWLTSAQDELTRIWLDADRREAVRNAADEIDRVLAIDPFLKDAVVLGDERTLIIEPLAVDFRVFEQDQKVIVGAVWMIGFLEDSHE